MTTGIALARIRFSFEEIRAKIMDMNSDNITTDQLKSLEEFLPTKDEEGILKVLKKIVAMIIMIRVIDDSDTDDGESCSDFDDFGDDYDDDDD
jgi:ABC-type antimicrobial peptide transport system permease subunit